MSWYVNYLSFFLLCTLAEAFFAANLMRQSSLNSGYRCKYIVELTGQLLCWSWEKERGKGSLVFEYDTSEVHGSWNCQVIHLNGKLKPLNWICFQWRAQVFPFLWIFKSASLSTRTATADKLTKSLGWKFLSFFFFLPSRFSWKFQLRKIIYRAMRLFSTGFQLLIIFCSPSYTRCSSFHARIKQEIWEIFFFFS